MRGGHCLFDRKAFYCSYSTSREGEAPEEMQDLHTKEQYNKGVKIPLPNLSQQPWTMLLSLF